MQVLTARQVSTHRQDAVIPLFTPLCAYFVLQSTDCKAVVSTVEGSSLDSGGFSLHIGLRDAYLPRMWVEKHPEKESEVCSFLLGSRKHCQMWQFT
jgi:hypothetical protein